MEVVRDIVVTMCALAIIGTCSYYRVSNYKECREAGNSPVRCMWLLT